MIRLDIKVGGFYIYEYEGCNKKNIGGLSE